MPLWACVTEMKASLPGSPYLLKWWLRRISVRLLSHPRSVCTRKHKNKVWQNQYNQGYWTSQWIERWMPHLAAHATQAVAHATQTCRTELLKHFCWVHSCPATPIQPGVKPGPRSALKQLVLRSLVWTALRSPILHLPLTCHRGYCAPLCTWHTHKHKNSHLCEQL